MSGAFSPFFYTFDHKARRGRERVCVETRLGACVMSDALYEMILPSAREIESKGFVNSWRSRAYGEDNVI